MNLSISPSGISPQPVGPGDMYGADSAESVVLYFLGNAQSFRGEKAKALKAELKSIFNIK